MLVPRHSFLTPLLLSSATFLVPFAHASDSIAGVENRAAPQHPQANANAVSVSGYQGLGRNKVDGTNSSRIQYKAVGVAANTNFNRLQFSFDITQLTRDMKDDRALLTLDKRTNTITPKLTYAVTEDYRLFVSNSFVRTQADNSNVLDDEYALNSSRTTLGAMHTTSQEEFTLSLATESEAKKDFAGPMGNPVIDRDYVPTQLDFDYLRHVGDQTNITAGVRYSHYNNDIYKDQYDSNIPKNPTIGQVFDYLLSFHVGASYIFNQYLDLSAELRRKAALDVNSYSGDEYVVAYTGLFDAVSHVTEQIAIGIGTEQSTGKKTHEVQSQSHDYTSRLESYRGFVSMKL